MSLSGTLTGIGRRRERLEAQGVETDSVNDVFRRQADDIYLTDTTSTDSAYAKRSIENDSVFILSHNSYGILGTSRLGDSGFTAWGAYL